MPELTTQEYLGEEITDGILTEMNDDEESPWGEHCTNVGIERIKHITEYSDGTSREQMMVEVTFTNPVDEKQYIVTIKEDT